MCPALYPHQLKLVEHDRAVVREADPEVGPTRILSQRAGPGTRNRRIPRSVEQESNALRLDGERRENPREGGTMPSLSGTNTTRSHTRQTHPPDARPK